MPFEFPLKPPKRVPPKTHTHTPMKSAQTLFARHPAKGTVNQTIWYTSSCRPTTQGATLKKRHIHPFLCLVNSPLAACYSEFCLQNTYSPHLSGQEGSFRPKCLGQKLNGSLGWVVSFRLNKQDPEKQQAHRDTSAPPTIAYFGPYLGTTVVGGVVLAYLFQKDRLSFSTQSMSLGQEPNQKHKRLLTKDRSLGCT